MENLYNYVFWYNSYMELWYAIPTKVYSEFFAGNKEAEGVLSSNKMETLMSIINNPYLLDSTNNDNEKN